MIHSHEAADFRQSFLSIGFFDFWRMKKKKSKFYHLLIYLLDVNKVVLSWSTGNVQYAKVNTTIISKSKGRQIGRGGVVGVKIQPQLSNNK
jgi:hypothetical protein